MGAEITGALIGQVLEALLAGAAFMFLLWLVWRELRATDGWPAERDILLARTPRVPWGGCGLLLGGCLMLEWSLATSRAADLRGLPASIGAGLALVYAIGYLLVRRTRNAENNAVQEECAQRGVSFVPGGIIVRARVHAAPWPGAERLAAVFDRNADGSVGTAAAEIENVLHGGREQDSVGRAVAGIAITAALVLLMLVGLQYFINGTVDLRALFSGNR